MKQSLATFADGPDRPPGIALADGTIKAADRAHCIPLMKGASNPADRPSGVAPMMGLTAPDHRPRGIALIEALIALLLLSVGFTAFAHLQQALRQATDDARQHATALQLLRNELEARRHDLSRSDASIRWETPTGDVLVDVSSRPIYNSSPAASLRTVRAQATWHDRTGRPRTAALHSLLFTLDPALPAFLLRAGR